MTDRTGNVWTEGQSKVGSGWSPWLAADAYLGSWGDLRKNDRCCCPAPGTIGW